MKDLIAGLAPVGVALAGRRRGALSGFGASPHVESLVQIARDSLGSSRGAINCSDKALHALHAFTYAAIAQDNLKQAQSYEDDAIEMNASLDDIRGASMGLIVSCLKR
jgi:hypothetical protein